ncbi:MAG: hypothetical protein ABWU84_05190, partial [Pyrobaculum sp.]|uniref:hypothetical protein n=1 Tax=Pyrobaculum sp. TaxID=2004705 RepID=UPI003EEA33B6
RIQGTDRRIPKSIQTRGVGIAKFRIAGFTRRLFWRECLVICFWGTLFLWAVLLYAFSILSGVSTALLG